MSLLVSKAKSFKHIIFEEHRFHNQRTCFFLQILNVDSAAEEFSKERGRGVVLFWGKAARKHPSFSTQHHTPVEFDSLS